jgi:FlaA1/EpsC-like NDP-sugar epimerase
MSEMINFNHRSTMNYIFAFVDAALVLSAVILAGFIHPGGWSVLFVSELYPVVKIMLIVVVVELTLYYFDLMDLKVLRHRIRTGVQLLKALGVYAVILVVIYYSFPIVSIGHRALFISLGLIFWVTFSWRLLYPWIASNALFKERVLIVGTGELARKIYMEIGENGLDAYEIVGFVDENGKRVGEKISPDDHRGFQANLFHLQNLSN